VRVCGAARSGLLDALAGAGTVAAPTALRAATAHGNATASAAMSDERPVDLNFLAQQQQRLMADQRLVLDELQVQGANTRRPRH
jgi:hypothetical protein